MAIKPLSFHLGKRDACPCQSINAGAEEKYLFSPCQEHTAGDGNVRDAVQKAMGRKKRSVGMVKGKSPAQQGNEHSSSSHQQRHTKL